MPKPKPPGTLVYRRASDPLQLGDYDNDLEVLIGGRVVDELKYGPRDQRLAKVLAESKLERGRRKRCQPK